MPRVLRTVLVALSLVLALAPGAGAAPPNDLARLASYGGPDRERILIDGAKKEGVLNFYGTIPVTDLNALAQEFQKKYGVKVTVWRSSSENVIQRVLSESRAGRAEVDFIESDGQAMETLHREGVLQKVVSPHTSELLPAAVQRHGEWVGTRIDVFMQAYNTNKVKQAELPKSYQDLLDPRWKGRLGIEANDVDWFAALCREMGEERTVKLFKDIVATNGLSVRKGHSLLVNLVASGEVPLALTVYNFTIGRLKREHAPLQEFTMAPVIARVSGVGVARRAAHPHAALLFYDYMITDGQRLLHEHDYTPTSKRIPVPEHKLALKYIDPNVLLDNGDKWTKLYEEVVAQKGGIR